MVRDESRRHSAAGAVAFRPILCLIAVLALVVQACASPGPTPSIGATGSASLDPALAGYEVEFRTLYGLQRDAEYLKSVAEDPASQAGLREFGVRLLPAEVAELKARATNVQQVFSEVQSYGERFPDDWAGIFVDNAGSGAVVAQFSENIDQHVAAIHKLVGPQARIEVRRVSWSIAVLSSAVAQITAERDWFGTIEASLEWAQVSEMDNQVDLSLSSKNPEAVRLTIEHFGGAGWLHAFSDGIGQWHGGVGQLVVSIVDAAGLPVGGTDDAQWLCRLVPDDPAAWRGGSLIIVDGHCRSSEPLGATTYAVTVTRDDGTGETVLANGTVEVPVNGTAELRLTASERPLPSSSFAPSPKEPLRRPLGGAGTPVD